MAHFQTAASRGESSYTEEQFKTPPLSLQVSSDYYSVVKKPIDMTIIGNKLSSGVYHTLDQIYDDMTLMTDNAFTYFPSDSQQAQDAIALQRAIVSKYTQLKGEL